MMSLQDSKSKGSYGAIPTENNNNNNVDNDDDSDDEVGIRMFKRMSTPPILSFSEPAKNKQNQQQGDGQQQQEEEQQHATTNFIMSMRYTIRDSVVNNTFRFSGYACSVRDVGGKATIPNEILNLVKNIVGAGALALPSGVAAFSSDPSGLFTASFWLAFMGAVFAYYFLLLGRTCRVTQTATYAEAWERTYGQAGSGLVALAVALKAGMGNLECSMILADSFRDLMATVGWHIGRTGALLLVTFAALLPLCLLKNLAVLAPFSMVGMLAMVFTAFAMAVRYFDGSYSLAADGHFLDDIAEEMKPSFGGGDGSTGSYMNVLIMLCMVSEAFIAHYNAPRFWIELKDRSVPRFGTVVGSSFGLSAFYYIFVTAFGFCTFGANSSGFILNNYSTHDNLASISRACVGFALVFGYPLIFVGFRDAMLDVLMIPPAMQTSNNLNLLTVFMLAIITVLAMWLEDLGIVTAIGGGTLGTVVVFIVPTLMFCRAVELLEDKATTGLRYETLFVRVLMWLGIAIGVTGVWITLTR